MRSLVLLVCLVAVAGCSSSGDRGRKEAAVPALTRETPLNRRLAELGVTHCEVAGLPSSNPRAPVKARATLNVASADGKTDAHRARIKVYDPATEELRDPDSDGSALIPVGGALLSVAALGGTAAVWFVHDKAKKGHEIDIAPEGDTPVAVSTNRPTDPSKAGMTAKTPRGTVDCTPVATTDEAVCALAPLTPEDAGKAELTATEDGKPVGAEEVTALSTSLWWVPEVVKPGTTGQLMVQILPKDLNVRAVITLAGGIQEAPIVQMPGKIEGVPGNFVITFVGNTTNLSGPVLTAVGADQPTEAALTVEVIK